MNVSPKFLIVGHYNIREFNGVIDVDCKQFMERQIKIEELNKVILKMFCNVLSYSSQLELGFDVLKLGSWVVLPKVGQLSVVDIGVDINRIVYIIWCQRCWDAVSASVAVRHVRFIGVTNCGDVNNIDETRDGGELSSFTLHKIYNSEHS